MTYLILKPTKQKSFGKKIYGFDIETYDKNKKFLLAVVHDGQDYRLFESKHELIDFFKLKRFYNSFVAATNLSFDWAGTFFGEEEAKEFKMLWRGSDLIFARTYIRNRDFDSNPKIKRQDSIVFVDTWNYAKLSVERIGKILNKPKFSKPDFLGRMHRNEEEKQQLVEYCARDAELSQQFLVFLLKSFYKLGASPRWTIASTAMSLFKNAYLNNIYYVHNKNSLLEQFKAYYGGNCHAYARGKIKNYYYYDFNSLYPYCMTKEFPDPNSRRECSMNRIRYIENYEGVSDVTVNVPYTDYPLLPLKIQTEETKSSAYKLLFPYGKFRGWYSHIELRKAMESGCSILRIHKSIYFKDICYPFVDFVRDLYEIRKEFKAKDSPMHLVVKLVLNSLYGKFGQKFENMENHEPFNHTLKELMRYDYFERVGDYIRLKKTSDRPAACCFPIWALYVTAYGRIHLHNYIQRCNPVYVDTDSLITKKEFGSSSSLGKLKQENFIKEGIIVKPKFYMINDICKVKGLGVKLTRRKFLEFLDNPKITYDKFMRFKESIRRGFIPNEIVEMTKGMGLEDNKRLWGEKFNIDELQFSKPLEVYDNRIKSVVFREQVVPLQSVV